MGEEDKLPFGDDPILFFDKIMEHLNSIAGSGSKDPISTSNHPVAAPLQKRKLMAKPSTSQDTEIRDVAIEKEQEGGGNKEDEVEAKDTTGAAEPKVPKADEYILIRTAPLKLIFRKVSASEAEKRRTIREGKRKVDDNINIHNAKKAKLMSVRHREPPSSVYRRYETGQSSASASSSSRAVEISESASSSIQKAPFNPMVCAVNNQASTISEAAEQAQPALPIYLNQQASTISKATDQAQPALLFDLNQPPPEET